MIYLYKPILVESKRVILNISAQNEAMSSFFGLYFSFY